MKKQILNLLIFAILILLIPMTVLLHKDRTSQDKIIQDDSPKITQPLTLNSDAEKTEYYKYFDIEKNKIINISVRDYLIGAVAAEIPANYEPEALKCQAIVAHTYAERRHIIAETNPEPDLNGADFSNDTSKYQAFFTLEQIKEFYADKFAEYYEKIGNAVDDVIDCVILYKDEPIIAAFHALSAGKTESAVNVWGNNVEYLVAAESDADKSSPDYQTEITFTKNQLLEKIYAYDPTIEFTLETKDYLKINSTTISNTVTDITVGNKTMTGTEVRSALGLRSAVFDIKVSEDNFIFTVKGYGHGVGMSQYGANEMAKSGKTFDEILKHYYLGIDIVS
ncbi:MAG: stage II sporulation protein D [Ruminococcus sp.]|jgi:stage II sporulation protein D|nr:stage II sporulation protein D [Ruminococcus sp.]